MKQHLLLSFFILISKFSFTQTDSTVLYLNSWGKNTVADSATTCLKLYKTSSNWYGKEYYLKTNTLKLQGEYLNNTANTPNGHFIIYDEKGLVIQEKDFRNGKLLQSLFYYVSGKKKAQVKYDNDVLQSALGWDENGNEISDYIYEREAKFKGGTKDWVKYLQQNLRANVAVDAGAPSGIHTVNIQYVIDKEGHTSNIKVIESPAYCSPCIAEAIRVIQNSPIWEPAIQFNKPVIYTVRQKLSFMVEEEKLVPKRN